MVIVRLERLKNKKKKMIYIVFSITIMILVLLGLLLFQSYAVFTEEKHFNVINGTVSDPGDIYFAYYVDNEITRNIPSKGSGYTLDTEKSNCTNGVSISFDNYHYAVITNYENYKASDYTRTRCDLYFKKLNISLVDYIKELSVYDNTNLDYDGTSDNNLRYIGANPNNYVSVDGELWRIIGVMNNIDDGTGKKETRIKLVKNESIGEYSWDSSDSSVNAGYGINEWSQADLMKLLNDGYENENVNNSLYWNNQSGACYDAKLNDGTLCDFTSSGIKKELKQLIANAVWNTGSNGSQFSWNDLDSYDFYQMERSSNTGKICTSGMWCTNDTVARTTAWTGKIALMYPSDYGYSTTGQDNISSEMCRRTLLSEGNYDKYSLCYENSWIYLLGRKWFLTPLAVANRSDTVYFENNENGTVHMGTAAASVGVFPTVYLKANVKVVSGDGTYENPFYLSEK